MADQEAKIVPFGKYKGRLLDELLIDDPDYLQWLSGQDWFRARFAPLYQIIINRGSAPEETPDHNAMQVRFLDDDFCLRFWRQIDPDGDGDEKVRQSLDRQRQSNLETIIKDLAFRYTEPPRKLELEQLRQIFVAPINLTIRVHRWFEERGIDVVLRIRVSSDRHHVESVPSHWYRWGWLVWQEDFNIELKPAIGDDYPAVLRQMKANDSKVLFVGTYTGQGASREQFIKTFATASIRVVFADQLSGAD